MAVISVMSYAPAPGKGPAAQAFLKDVLAVLEGFGAHGWVTTLIRGGVPGTLNLVTEYADSAVFHAALDRTSTDPNIQKLLSRAQIEQALTPVNSFTRAELPGLEVPVAEIASHTAVRVTHFKIRDGKYDLSMGRLHRLKAIFERHGAKARAVSPGDSDPAGVYGLAVYYPNLTEAGKIGMAVGADPETQAYAAESRSEPSVDVLRTTLMRVL